MKLYMDLHTHTVACGHAYSTLKENIEAAREMGLTYLGLSEHGPAMGVTDWYFFGNYGIIPREYGDLRLFCGMEANILDYDGNLDLEEDLLPYQDYVIASMHSICVKSGTVEQNTMASIRAMEKPYVKILGHPDDSRYPLDYDELIKAAKREGVAIELNNSSLTHRSRKNTRENFKTILHFCKQYDVPVILGTDSHYHTAVGHFENALEVIKEEKFPEELIINANPENIKRVLNIEI